MTDISLAKQTLNTLIASRTDELAGLQVAADLLNNTFQAEFTNLELAQAETADFAAKWNAEKAAHAETAKKLAELEKPQ